jgi:tetratricopeptide (TPR) repeat protein
LQQKLLEQARAYFDRFLREAPNDPDLLADVADAHYRLGLITRKIGSVEQALAEYQQARDLLEPLVRDVSDPTLLVPLLIDVYRDLGNLQARTTGRSREALASYQRGQELCRQRLQTHPGDPEYQYRLAESHGNIGMLRHELGDAKEARSSFLAARDLLQELVRADATNTRVQETLARTFHNLGRVNHTSGQFGEALGCYRQALELRKELAAARPTMPDLQLDLAASYGEIGRTQWALNQLNEALSSLQKDRQIVEKVVQANPSVNDYQHVLAQIHGTLGNVQSTAGQWPAALDSFEQARAILETLVRANPSGTQLQGDLAASYINLGDVYDRKGQTRESIAACDKACTILEKLSAHNPDIPEFHSQLAIARHNSGEGLGKMGRHQEALGAYQAAIGEQRVALAKAPHQTLYRQLLAAHYTYLARTHRELDRPAEAVAALLACTPLCATDGNQLYDLACDLALCGPLVGKNKTELNAQEQAQRQQYTQHALDALQLAIAQGFRNVKQLQSDPRLASLRSQAAFQKVLAAAHAKK